MVAAPAIEGLAFILIGIRFLSKKVEQSREGWIYDATGLIPLFPTLP